MALVIQTIFCCHLLKMRNAVLVRTLVDVEQVLSHIGIEQNGCANINILQTIVVDINDRGAAAPSALTIHSSSIGNVFKFEIALVEIELVGNHVPGEIDILEAVVIKVTKSQPGPVV